MNSHYPFTNPPLPFAFDALEPYIDAKTMELHHDKHLQTYVDHLNEVLTNYAYLQNLSLEQLLYTSSQLPASIKVPIQNNAGGVYNHIFFFDGLEVGGGMIPDSKLINALASTYGSLEKFMENFTEAALSVFGSGYAWLTLNRRNQLQIVTTANQDTPITQNICPIMNIDVWEHAYYLKHYNKRIDYIGDWFNLINWDKAEKNYLACQRK